MDKIDDLEIGMQKSLALQELWKRFTWPASQWSRLQMLRLQEDEHKKVSTLVREDTRYAAESMWFTDQVENGGNVLSVENTTIARAR